MKKIALVLNAGKPGQLQSGDWIGPRKTVASTSPTVDDDITSGYEIGSRWINTAIEREFVCMSAADGAAVWVSGDGPDLASDIDAEDGTDNEKYMSALRTWQQIQHKISAGLNVTFAPTPEGFSINSSASASQFIMWPDAPSQVGNVYKDWGDLCTTIAALPDGEMPTIIFRQSMAIPLTDMPVGGWDMRLGRWMSPVMATGAVTVTLADGVKIENLVWIESGLAVEVSPTTADGVFSNNLLGGLNILIVALGAQLKNFGSKALIDSAGQVVMVLNGASQEIGGPPATAPFVKMNGTDVLIAIMLGDSPNTAWYDDCFVGGNSGSALFFIHGITFDAPNLPNWTGDAPVFSTAGKAKNLIYDDTLQSPASGSTNVQGVIDWLKTQVGGGSVAPVVFYFDPDNGSPSGTHYNDFATMMTAIDAVTALGNEVRLLINKPGISQSVSVPADSYDFSNIVIEATAGTITPYMDFADGSSITPPKRVIGVRLRNFNTSAPLITISGAKFLELVDSALVNDTSATEPALSVPASQSLTIEVFSSIDPISKEGSGSAPVFCDGDLVINLRRFSGSMLTTNNLFYNDFSEIGSIQINSYAFITGGYSRNDANLDPQVGYTSLVEGRVDERIATVRPVKNSAFGASPVAFVDFSFVGDTAPVGAPSAGWKWNSINGITNLQLLAPFTTPGVNITEVTFNMPGLEDDTRPPVCGNFPIFFKGTVNQTTECKVEFQRTFAGTNRIKFIFDAPVALSHLYCNLTYGTA